MVRLSIKEAIFVLGRENVPEGHLIWPRHCPEPFLTNLSLDQGYRGNCEILHHGKVVFSGLALVKRHQQYGKDLLVILLPDVDLGELSPDATVEMNPCALELD